MNETETFTLPQSKKTVIIRGYMTGYIDQEVRKILAAGNNMSYEVDPEQAKIAEAKGEEPTPSKILISQDPTVSIDATNKKIELMVTALDGSNGDILNKVLELPKADVDFIQEQIDKIAKASGVEGDDPKAPSN